MEEQTSLMADHEINWQNILLVQRTNKESDTCVFIVYFSDDRSVAYPSHSPEGEAILKHWEKYAPNRTDGAERIPVV